MLSFEKQEGRVEYQDRISACEKITFKSIGLSLLFLSRWFDHYSTTVKRRWQSESGNVLQESFIEIRRVEFWNYVNRNRQLNWNSHYLHGAHQLHFAFLPLIRFLHSRVGFRGRDGERNLSINVYESLRLLAFASSPGVTANDAELFVKISRENFPPCHELSFRFAMNPLNRPFPSNQ